ncbi:uncharacterized protein [Cicer arietinum]|uniref:Uncharacterized protein LOC101491282 n=1 Tax=Cicer arietinum TaxID=3827 RepID=A0A1S2YMS1_CICAR|nr:uncharacterized protein LOC101491282 [Cicer arietinum]
MAKRELSSTLKNLKFMQRASLIEEKTNIKVEVKHGTNSPTTRKCVVLTEGDPHPSALKGRMSFQNFNPSVEKLNPIEENFSQAAAKPETAISRNESENASFRESSTSVEGQGCSNLIKENYKVSGSVKRKQKEIICETQYPSKSPKNGKGNRKSSSKHCLVSVKKQRGGVVGWNVLRTAKCQTK